MVRSLVKYQRKGGTNKNPKERKKKERKTGTGESDKKVLMCLI